MQLCTFPPQGSADSEEVVYFPSFLQIRQPSCLQHLSTARLQALLQAGCFQETQYPSYIVEIRTMHNIQDESTPTLNIAG